MATVQFTINKLQEDLKISQNLAHSLQQDLDRVREEMLAKDNYLTTLNEKLKQARTTATTPQTPAIAPQAKATIAQLSDEIQKLKLSNAAHQSQCAWISSEMDRTKRECKREVQVKDDTIKSLRKDIDELRQEYQKLRQQVLLNQGAPQDYLQELDHVKRVLFCSVGSSIKNSRNLPAKHSNLDFNLLYDQAKNVPYDKYHDWIMDYVNNTSR